MKALLEAINRGILRGLNEQNIELLADFDDENLDLLDSILAKSVNNKMHALYRFFPTTKEDLVEIIKAEIESHGWNCNLNHIDVNRITDMSYLFGSRPHGFDFGYDLELFNGDISRWDVSNVTNMNGMFWCAKAFNHPIGDWDVSNVTTMEAMFCGAESFNQPIGDWDVSKVKDMNCMFWYAESFNQSIRDWDVSNVVNMRGMFYWAGSFNQPIGDWDVSKVENMSRMFEGGKSFNQDLSNWQIKTNCDTTYIFNKCPIEEEYKPKGIKE